MIQFNLLPDIKLEYIRTRRTKRLIMLSSAAAGGAALIILILLFSVVHGLQRKHLNDLNNDVTKYTNQLKETPELSKVLTVQNQLNSLPALHDKKPAATRLFAYIGQVTPAQVSISEVNITFIDNTIELTGAANSISTVNTFVDTLKFTTFTTADSSDPKKAFSEVVLASFGRDDKGASYEITFKFDPLIFDGNSEIKLVVPQQITTRSETEKPTDLFQPNIDSSTGGQ